VADIREVGVAEVRDSQRQHADARLAQVARRQVWLIAGHVDGLPDAFARFGRHIWIVVDDVRHGLDGHAGPRRDILEGRGHHHTALFPFRPLYTTL